MIGYRRVVIAVVALWVVSSARADWIKPVVSTRAGIDSIQRVLVIRDTDSLQSFGKKMLDLGDIEGGLGNELLITRWQGGLDSNRCFIYDGGQFSDGLADRSYLYFGRNLDRIGDINGDGFVDFGQYHLPLKTPEDFDIFFGGPQFDSISDLIIPNHISFAYDAVDVDGDGILELPVKTDFSPSGGTIDLFEAGASFDTIPKYSITDTSQSFGYTLCTGDFNGDGLGDIAISSYVGVGGYDTGRVNLYFGATPYDTTVDLVIKDSSMFFGRILYNVGDFNKDGYDDLLICDGNTPGGIFLGSASFDGTRDIVVNQYRGDFGYFPPTSVERAGDVNNDGYPDFIIGYVVPGARYEAHLYLGGPDITPFMPADLWIEDFMIPGPQYNFGESVAGIGDLTGDGIDDFAVRSTTDFGSGIWYGEVNIFAGWKSTSTEVENNDEPSLPVSCGLRQNYPNPFNPSTRIPYFTDRPGMVDLRVINPLGQTVKVLIHEYLPAVSKAISWNAMSDATPASSGVYYCRLSLDGVPQHSIKMLFVK